MTATANCCDNIVIRCMDFRFHAKLPRLLADHFNVERFDHDSPGGCGGSLSLLDEATRQQVLNALELAISLHGVKRLVIVDHVDCGAYGGSARFCDAEAERQFHAERLREAREIVCRSHPELAVVLLYQDFDGLSAVN